MGASNNQDTEERDKDVLLHAYQTARAWASLLVSLATGIIVFTAIFKRDIAVEGQPLQATGWLLTSWIVLGISTLCGVLYLATLIPQLNSGLKKKLDLYSIQPRLLALLLWITFLAGLALFGVFAVANLP